MTRCFQLSRHVIEYSIVSDVFVACQDELPAPDINGMIATSQQFLEGMVTVYPIHRNRLITRILRRRGNPASMPLRVDLFTDPIVGNYVGSFAF